MSDEVKQIDPLMDDILKRFKRPLRQERIIYVKQDSGKYDIVVHRYKSIFDIKETADYPPGFDYSIDA